MRSRLLAAPVALLLLAACGGDDGGGGGSSASVRATAASAQSDLQSDLQSDEQSDEPDTTAEVATGVPDGVVSLDGLSQDHVDDDVAYSQTPPMGGPHAARWATCGFHDEPVLEEQGVHSMEHGAVWITYQPGLAADQVAVLEALTSGRTHVLVSPYDGLPSPVVASAWGQQLVLDSATDPRLAQFVDYFEEGPQTPEPGAPC